MKERTFKALVRDAKRQLDNDAIYGYGGTLQANAKCDKMARVLQAKIDEITETYLDDVPESFENMEALEGYIHEVQEVLDELKLDELSFREWGRSYGLTEYARAILLDADDVVQDLVFERSACERAYDIVYEFIKNEEKAEICTEESTERGPYWDWGECPTETGTKCTGKCPTETGTKCTGKCSTETKTTCTGECPTETGTECTGKCPTETGTECTGKCSTETKTTCTGECSTKTRSYFETYSTDDEGGVTVRNEKYEP